MKYNQNKQKDYLAENGLHISMPLTQTLIHNGFDAGEPLEIILKG